MSSLSVLVRNASVRIKCWCVTGVEPEQTVSPNQISIEVVMARISLHAMLMQGLSRGRSVYVISYDAVHDFH